MRNPRFRRPRSTIPIQSFRSTGNSRFGPAVWKPRVIGVVGFQLPASVLWMPAIDLDLDAEIIARRPRSLYLEVAGARPIIAVGRSFFPCGAGPPKRLDSYDRPTQEKTRRRGRASSARAERYAAAGNSPRRRARRSPREQRGQSRAGAPAVRPGAPATAAAAAEQVVADRRVPDSLLQGPTPVATTGAGREDRPAREL